MTTYGAYTNGTLTGNPTDTNGQNPLSGQPTVQNTNFPTTNAPIGQVFIPGFGLLPVWGQQSGFATQNTPQFVTQQTRPTAQTFVPGFNPFAFTQNQWPVTPWNTTNGGQFPVQHQFAVQNQFPVQNQWPQNTTGFNGFTPNFYPANFNSQNFYPQNTYPQNTLPQNFVPQNTFIPNFTNLNTPVTAPFFAPTAWNNTPNFGWQNTCQPNFNNGVNPNFAPIWNYGGFQNAPVWGGFANTNPFVPFQGAWNTSPVCPFPGGATGSAIIEGTDKTRLNREAA